MYALMGTVTYLQVVWSHILGCFICFGLSLSLSLSHFITLFPGITLGPDTDIDSVCHFSLSLSLSLSISLSRLSLSLCLSLSHSPPPHSVSPSLQGPECLQMHFSVAHCPSLLSSLSPCLTLSVFPSTLYLSLAFPQHTRSTINKARDSGGSRRRA